MNAYVVASITLLILAFIQNISFSIVSRSRNRNNMRFHLIAAFFSNSIWFLTFRHLIKADMSLYLFPWYCVGTMLGSVFGVRISMLIEKWLGAEADSHVKKVDTGKLNERVTRIEKFMQIQRRDFDVDKKPTIKTRDRLPGKPSVYVTVGFSRCGKTTWANRHRKNLDATIVCGDDIRRALGDKEFNYAREPVVNMVLSLAVRALVLRGQNVIVKATSLRRGDRAQWVRLSEDGLATVNWIHFERPPMKEWQARCVQANFDWRIIEHQIRIFEGLDALEIENIGVIDGSRG